MRRFRLVLLALLPLALVTIAFVGLTSVARAADPPQLSSCGIETSRLVDPTVLPLGATTRVSLIVTGTCPASRIPMDIVFLVDESNSMIKSQNQHIPRQTPGEPTKPATPDPSAGPPTREPTAGPTSSTGGGGGDAVRGSEPPFCNPNQGRRSQEPTEPARPTPRPTPNPLTPEPPVPETPGSIIPPRTTPPASDQPNIEDLEPAGAVDQIREMRSWLRDVVGLPEIEEDLANGSLRMGFVSFSERARVRIALSEDKGDIVSGAAKLHGGNVTRINQGLNAAKAVLDDRRAKLEGERLRVIVVLSDFQFCQSDMKRVDRSIEVVAVGFGVRAYDRRKMTDLATERRFTIENHSLKTFKDLYRDVLRQGRSVDVEQMTIRDELSETMQLVAGSPNPPTVTVQGQLLEWQILTPTLPMTLTYEVVPQLPGIHPVSVGGNALWLDSEGLNASVPFPGTDIEVLPPTPTPTSTSTPTPTSTFTPTPTDTPTATPTPKPKPQYFPVAYRQPPKPTPPAACDPELETVDVALIVDTSTSMSDPTSLGRPKLDAAIEAAEELVRLLKPLDQATVVGFNRTATLATQLTDNKNRVVIALRALPGTQAVGTSLYRGLDSGYQELMSERRRTENDPSIVLVTDGYHNDPEYSTDDVRNLAAQIRADGIQIVTVGLGDQVDEELLKDVAGSDDLYFAAPDAEELTEIYRSIAELIPCP